MGKIYKTIDLFAGIGGIRLGFEAYGCENVFSSEWDKYAQMMYEANFHETPFGDINDIAPEDIPEHDILLAGFPCQPFSIAGKGLGFADTRGTLFFNIEAILKAKQPEAFLLENVKRLTTHDNGNTFAVILDRLNKLGYTVYYKVFNSLDFGVPQKRERIYIVGFKNPIQFKFPKPLGYFKPLSEVLEKEEDIPSSYFLSETMKQKRFSALKTIPPKPSIWHENIGGNISPLPYSCALRAGGSYNYLVVNGERRLTSREMLRLQGFPDSFIINIPYSQARKVAGNSVSVPVIQAIAGEMIKTLNEQKTVVKYKELNLFGDYDYIEAKQALDKIISKGRVHLYKPIQIAEILYRDRVYGDIDLADLNTYRNASKRWRDIVCLRFLGRTSTSSARYQDDVFNENAVPPSALEALGTENRQNNGVVEKYIYDRFEQRFSQMSSGLDYCNTHDKSNFQVIDFINLFWNEPGLKRSVDKIYEIVVYALFSALIECLKVKVTVEADKAKQKLLEEFSDFAERVIGLSKERSRITVNARINRVGVTNAADRGLDMWANFGMAIQIKHLSLTEELAENIVSSVSSDRIVIVCKDSEEKLIVSLLTQIGWKSKIQSIVTENDLMLWYEKALRGTFAEEIGDKVLSTLYDEILLEFPATNSDDFNDFKHDREYDSVVLNDIWNS